MSFIKLCSDDKLLKTLRETFSANPITVPEERIKPLVVLSRTNSTTYLGPINDLIENGELVKIEIKDSVMANVSGTSSKSVKVNIGLQIMDGFLKGFGVGSGAIKSSFNDTKQVSFSFQNVHRYYVDVTALTKNLKNRKFDPKDPIVKAFIEEKAKCHVITSVITSNNFSMKKEEQNGTNIDFNINAINSSLGSENKIEASSSSKLEISFKGQKQLAFAYTAAILEIDIDGNVSYSTESDESFLTNTPEDNDTEFIEPEYFIENAFGLSEIKF
ncbi:hypothetical protein K6T82_03960 [Flavobacterium sp. 17A]|uniref:Gasdermin bGSDM n=1 Tax=Flavobacterium potami TaxID=2872310 RepID=A0A9X1KQ96_9FLAO|nr:MULTISPECIES: hypothetical protein [Flavobacterium]MBZ4033906.1 hypothetical protein [Flavobacterium potami]